jgi:hypothetical protein
MCLVDVERNSWHSAVRIKAEWDYRKMEME